MISYEDAAEAVLGKPRPDPGHAPGQRRRHAIPLGDLRHHATRSSRPRALPRERYGEALKAAGLGADHHRDREGRAVLLRRRLSSAISRQEPRRLLRARRHRRLLPDRRRRRRRAGVIDFDAATPRGVALARLAARLSAAGVRGRAARGGAACCAPPPRSAPAILSPRPKRRWARPRRGSKLSRGGGRPGSRSPRIEGRRAFWGHEFAVTPDVLDPRADTETLVEAALAALCARRARRRCACSISASAPARSSAALLGEWPRATGARRRRRAPLPRRSRRAQSRGAGPAASARACRSGDWGEGLDGAFDVIVSNPPYIRSRRHRRSRARSARPRSASGARRRRRRARRLSRPGAGNRAPARAAGPVLPGDRAGQGDEVAAILARGGAQRRRSGGATSAGSSGCSAEIRLARRGRAMNIGGLASLRVAA